MLLLPCREWWPVTGTVTAAFDGFGFNGLGLKAEGGKCFRL